MSRKYKFRNSEGLYLVSFATVFWIDVFVRELYFQIMVNSMKHCRQNLGMELYAYCIMPSHVHLVFRDKNKRPEILLGRLKEFISKQITKAINDNREESRKEWLLWMFTRAGLKSCNVKGKQFWQHNNKPIELFSADVIDQKINYIPTNPVMAGFVLNDEDSVAADSVIASKLFLVFGSSRSLFSRNDFEAKRDNHEGEGLCDFEVLT
jgi:putative transposase